MPTSPLATVLALTLVCTAATAQSPLRPTKISAPVKDRGTYHIATGTWSRADPAASFNSEVLFNNSAPSGYFFGTSGCFNTIDHGRLPSPTSPSSPTSVPGTSTVYTIDCYELSYCSNIPLAAGGVSTELEVYEHYRPCSDLDKPGNPYTKVADLLVTGLAGGTPSSGQGCWTASFDLSNTTAVFSLGGDAGGSWDDDPATDSFGWGLQFPNASAGNNTGPLIAGKCPSGSIAGGPTTPRQGFGTKFASPAIADATGLGTSDFFWIDCGGLLPNGNGGCFFFGAMGNGCTDPSITGPARNPFGGFFLKLFGRDGIESIGSRYCPSALNSTGSRALLSAAATDVNADLVFTSAPVPETTGQFFYGPMMLAGLPFGLGDGFKCVGGMSTRLLPFISAGMMMLTTNTSVLAVNYSAPYAAGLTGTKHFQHWFRDITAAGSNASDALSISF